MIYIYNPRNTEYNHALSHLDFLLKCDPTMPNAEFSKYGTPSMRRQNMLRERRRLLKKMDDNNHIMFEEQQANEENKRAQAQFLKNLGKKMPWENNS